MKKVSWKTLLLHYAFMLVASIFYGIALNMFLVPHRIVAGGVTGLATLVSLLSGGISVGLLTMLFNLPILFLGLRQKGLVFILNCLITTVVLSFITELLSFLPSITDNAFLAAVYGGLLQGIGIGLFCKYNMSSGGTELLARVLYPHCPGISLAALIGVLDGIIVLLGAFLLKQPENVLLALTVIFVSSRVSDTILTGLSKAKLCYIITNKPDEVGAVLLAHSPRGITNINGTGMYAKVPRGVLLTCIKPRQMGQLKQLVNDVDADAFVIVSETTEVLGNGFKRMDEEF